MSPKTTPSAPTTTVARSVSRPVVAVAVAVEGQTRCVSDHDIGRLDHVVVELGRLLGRRGQAAISERLGDDRADGTVQPFTWVVLRSK